MLISLMVTISNLLNIRLNYRNKKNGNTTIAEPLKYQSNFWKSLEMSVIKCKGELDFDWKKHCALSAAAADNADVNSNTIPFTLKGTILYIPVVTLSKKDNKKLSKLLSKGFERSVHWSEYKTKSENENTTNKYKYFLESNC